MDALMHLYFHILEANIQFTFLEVGLLHGRAVGPGEHSLTQRLIRKMATFSGILGACC